MLERRQTGAQNPGFVEDLQRPRRSGDPELVARSTLERTHAVRANLGADTKRAQEPERPARDGRVADVELYGHFSSPTEVHAPGGVEEAGELRQAVTLAPRRDRRELVT